MSGLVGKRQRGPAMTKLSGSLSLGSVCPSVRPSRPSLTVLQRDTFKEKSLSLGSLHIYSSIRRSQVDKIELSITLRRASLHHCISMMGPVFCNRSRARTRAARANLHQAITIHLDWCPCSQLKASAPSLMAGSWS